DHRLHLLPLPPSTTLETATLDRPATRRCICLRHFRAGARTITRPLVGVVPRRVCRHLRHDPAWNLGELYSFTCRTLSGLPQRYPQSGSNRPRLLRHRLYLWAGSVFSLCQLAADALSRGYSRNIDWFSGGFSECYLALEASIGHYCGQPR